MQEEIARLKDQSDAQVNNLTGAGKDQAIAKEMEAVSKRYQALIDRGKCILTVCWPKRDL